MEIEKILLSSRSTIDIYWEGNIARASGEICTRYFLADPYGMYWISESDLEALPWMLPMERRAQCVREQDRLRLLEATKAYNLHAKYQIVFLTTEMEDFAFDLADKIRRNALSSWHAKKRLRQSFPGYPSDYYKDQLLAALAGMRWR